MAAPRPRLVHRAGHAWEQVVLPALAHRARADVLLNPANLAPLAFGRNVVILFDAAAVRHPEWYSPAYAAWQARIGPAVARRALHVLTVSEFSRAELVELFGVRGDRISVIPSGVDGRFAAATPTVRARPYVLCVASHTARKNLRALVPAAATLAREGVELVVAGGRRPQFAAEAGLEGLTLLGGVDDAALPGLYAGAEAFVLPSLYEGFGLPVLEAMAAGTPVVTTDVTALPEAAGGAARLVAPEPEALRDALVTLLGDPAERARLVGLGRERAAGFTWDRAARAVDAVLSDSATRRPAPWRSPRAGARCDGTRPASGR